MVERRNKQKATWLSWLSAWKSSKMEYLLELSLQLNQVPPLPPSLLFGFMSSQLPLDALVS
jgi:hypothetical protein